MTVVCNFGWNCGKWSTVHGVYNIRFIAASSQKSNPALGHIPPVQGERFPRVPSEWDAKLTTHSHFMPRLRINGVYLPLPHMPQLRARGQHSMQEVRRWGCSVSWLRLWRLPYCGFHHCTNCLVWRRLEQSPNSFHLPLWRLQVTLRPSHTLPGYMGTHPSLQTRKCSIV